MKTALFIGRFQPFHKGHLDALYQILRDADFVKVAIGSSNKKRTPENPLSYTERKQYIERIMPFKNYRIYPVPDQPSDTVWLKDLKKTIGPFDVAYSSNDWVCGILTSSNIPYKPLEFKVAINATKIREMIRKKDARFQQFLVKPFPKKLQLIIERTAET